MKQTLTFVLGGVFAAAVVFLLMKGKEPPKPEATPVPAITTPATPEPSAVQATPEPAPQPSTPSRSQAKQSALGARAPERRNHGGATPKKEETAAPAPSQTAQNAPFQVAPPPPAANPAPAPVFETRKPEPPPRQPKTVTIPSGTLLAVRVDDRLSSSTNHAGDSFRATLDQPIVVDGMVIAERGARVEGRVVEADPGGRVRGTAHLSLELVRLDTSDGQRVKLQTQSFAKEAQTSKKKDAAKIGAAAGIGAAIGAIAGGGRGAAIGAAAGGAAGTGGVMATRGDAAEIPSETRLSFRLNEPITITEKLH